MRLNFLTNSNANLQAKMRFFSDFFLYANENLGRFPDLLFDNPVSLVNKVIFQLENNIEKCPTYVDNHLSQLLDFYGAFLKNDFKAFTLLESEIQAYQQSGSRPREKITWLKDHPGFLEGLKELEAELEVRLFDRIYFLLVQYITCPHELSHHANDIRYCTQILVAMFRLNGHSKDSVDDYIERILSRDRFDFPFPIHVYQAEDEQSFQKIAEGYLADRNFSRQFEGLKNLMVNPTIRNGYFVFVIENVQLFKGILKTFEVKFNRVTFISPRHDLFKMVRDDVRRSGVTEVADRKVYARFFGPRRLLAFVKLNYENKKDAGKEGYGIALEELAHFERYLGKELAIRKTDYLFIEDFSKTIWHSSISLVKQEVTRMGTAYFESLKKNPFELLRNSASRARDQLLFNEAVFSRSRKENSTGILWQYIENLFWFQNEKNEHIRANFIALIMHELEKVQSDTFGGLRELIMYTRHSNKIDEIAPDKDELRILELALNEGRDGFDNVQKCLSGVTHPFLKWIIEEYLKITATSYDINWSRYFNSLIKELQETRNAELHSGRFNAYSRIKMK
ncbi:MAG TPA: hypothetical protein VK588_00480, partial [Chitinophagaceae bacterium]|nr:hypothetical protein [Chitinophagaceae bacterium]